MSSSGQSNQSTSAFIIKLFEILAEDYSYKYEKIVKWSIDGSHFLVLDTKLMEQDVLIYFFKHQNFKSFLRQLNMYQFIKSRDSQGYQVFMHPNFKRDQKYNIIQQQQKILAYPRNSQHQKASKQYSDLKKIKNKATKLDFQLECFEELDSLKNQNIEYQKQFAKILFQNQNILQQHRQIQEEFIQMKKNEKIEEVFQLILRLHQDSIDSNSVLKINNQAQETQSVQINKYQEHVTTYPEPQNFKQTPPENNQLSLMVQIQMLQNLLNSNKPGSQIYIN